MGQHANLVRALGLLVLALFVTQGVAPGDVSAAGEHPFYDDDGTLTWHTSLTEARIEAARTGKLIFVDYSMPDCEVCRQVIHEILPSQNCGARVARIAVGLHVDARVGNRQLYDMFKSELRNATYLPWIAFITPGQAWVAGMAPSQVTPPSELRRRLMRAISSAEARQQSLASIRGDVPDDPTRPLDTGDPDGAVGDPDGTVRGPRVDSTETSIRRDRPTATTPSDELQWFSRLSDAQAAARASGKMIFVMSTRAQCSLCKKLKNDVAPRISRELARSSVAYVYDITRPESSQLDMIVRKNLPGAYIMPLAGFVTADLRWLHGFFGKTDVETLRADFQTACQRMR